MYLEIVARIRSAPPLRTVCYFSGLAASRCTAAADLKNCILYSITRLSVRAASSYNSKRIPRIPRGETLLSLSFSLSFFLSPLCRKWHSRVFDVLPERRGGAIRREIVCFGFLPLGIDNASTEFVCAIESLRFGSLWMVDVLN